jgi:hypothetical protein
MPPLPGTVHFNVNIENLERPVSIDSANMVSETLRLPEDIKATSTFEGHPLAFGVVVVTVFLRPCEIPVLRTVHG